MYPLPRPVGNTNTIYISTALEKSDITEFLVIMSFNWPGTKLCNLKGTVCKFIKSNYFTISKYVFLNFLFCGFPLKGK